MFSHFLPFIKATILYIQYVQSTYCSSSYSTLFYAIYEASSKLLGVCNIII